MILMAQRDKIIKLNVGGSLYTSSRSTLTSVPGSYLARIAIGEVICLRDYKGTVFVDRDGHVFRYILNYLRTGKLVVPQGYKELHMLREEADYFGLPSLSAEVDKVLRSRRRRNKKPHMNKAQSRSLSNLCDENGSVIFEDDSSDYFYD